ncbi:MAG: copper transporter [Dehalobacterium sp.]
MIDFKYHVTALVAVFLALGIGMLIGSLALGNEFIGNQQEALINRLEGDFQQLRIQNGLTKSELAAAYQEAETYQAICRQMMPALIKNKLENYRVVVVQTSQSKQNNNLSDIISPLEIAGAQVDAVISLADDFALTQVSSTYTQSKLGEEKSIMELLGEAIILGDENGVLADLAAQKLMTISGETGNSIDAVILVGGSDRELDAQVKNLDLILSDFLTRKGISVIGVETSTVCHSYIPDYQNHPGKPAATVDNIDQITGQISLVYSILGAQGDFGVKETADSLLPDLMQNQFSPFKP